jgi:hypothetical protein
MKTVKLSATLVAIGLVLLVVAWLVVYYSIAPTIVEKPIYVRQYVEERVPVYVQPAWWGFYGAPWGAHSTPWKMGSGLPGMKAHPPAGPSPPPTEPSQPPAVEPPPPAPETPVEQPAT